MVGKSLKEIGYLYPTQPTHLVDVFKTVAQAFQMDNSDARDVVTRGLGVGDLVWADPAGFTVVKRKPE